MIKEINGILRLLMTVGGGSCLPLSLLFPLSSRPPVTPRGKKGAAGRRAGIGAPWVRQRVPGPLGASAPTPPRLLGGARILPFPSTPCVLAPAREILLDVIRVQVLHTLFLIVHYSRSALSAPSNARV